MPQLLAPDPPGAPPGGPAGTPPGNLPGLPDGTPFAPWPPWQGYYPHAVTAFGFTVRSVSTYASAATETPATLMLPMGWLPGDVIYIGWELTATNGVVTTPSGWTVVAGPVAANNVPGVTSAHHGVLRRVMQAGDANSVTITITSGRFAAALVAIQGADQATPEDVIPATDDNTGVTTPSVRAPSVTPVTRGCLLLTFHAVRNGTNGAATAFTPDPSETENADAAAVVTGISGAAIEAATLALTDISPTGVKTATATGTVSSINMMGSAVAVRLAGAQPVIPLPPPAIYPPGWQPGAPGQPGSVPFAWSFSGDASPVGGGADSLDAAATVTAAAAAALTEAKPLTAAVTVAAACAAALAESKPLNAASAVTAAAAAAETTSKPLAAALTATAAAAASLAVIKAGVTPAPAYPPAWFPAAPGVPGGKPFAPWPAWSGSGGISAPVDLLNAAATVTAAAAAALTESKPLAAAVTVTAGRAAAETTAKPATAAVTVTAGMLASLAVQAAAPGSFTAPRLYAPAWFPGAPAVPAAEAFAPWPPWTGLLAAVAPPFTIGVLTAADKPGSALTAGTAASTLTAATAAQAVLTARDQRTGGPS